MNRKTVEPIGALSGVMTNVFIERIPTEDRSAISLFVGVDWLLTRPRPRDNLVRSNNGCVRARILRVVGGPDKFYGISTILRCLRESISRSLILLEKLSDRIFLYWCQLHHRQTRLETNFTFVIFPNFFLYWKKIPCRVLYDIQE